MQHPSQWKADAAKDMQEIDYSGKMQSSITRVTTIRVEEPVVELPDETIDVVMDAAMFPHGRSSQGMTLIESPQKVSSSEDDSQRSRPVPDKSPPRQALPEHTNDESPPRYQ